MYQVIVKSLPFVSTILSLNHMVGGTILNNLKKNKKHSQYDIFMPLVLYWGGLAPQGVCTLISRGHQMVVEEKDKIFSTGH